MANICRLCAAYKTNDLLVPLFDSVHSIPAKVRQYCGIDISDDPAMPQNVCKGCLDDLNRSAKLAEIVSTAQNTLSQAMGSCSVNSNDRAAAPSISSRPPPPPQPLPPQPHVTLTTPTDQGRFEFLITDDDAANGNYDDMAYEVFDSSSDDDDGQMSNLLVVKHCEATLNPIETTEIEIDTKPHWPAMVAQWKDFPCSCADDNCQKRFSGVNDLRLHVHNNHPHYHGKEQMPTDKLYKCDICAKAFNLFKKLIYHSIAKHVPHLGLRCFVCEEEFADNHLLNNHMQRHQTKEKCFPCTFCTKTFTSSFAVKRHQSGMHPEQFKLTCENCGKVLPDAQSFAAHLADHRNQIKRSKGVQMCDSCGYTTKRPHSFRVHKCHKNPKQMLKEQQKVHRNQARYAVTFQNRQM